MRGQLPNQPSFISLINVETMIPETHPIRVIKRMCDEVLARLSPHLDRIYAADGAPSIPPETLLKGKVRKDATSIFVCENKVCQLPVGSVAAALIQMQ